MRRDTGNFQMLVVVGAAVFFVLFVISSGVGAVNSPIQIFADDDDSGTTTPTPESSDESLEAPTPIGTPPGSSSDSDSSTDGDGSSTDGDGSSTDGDGSGSDGGDGSSVSSNSESSSGSESGDVTAITAADLVNDTALENGIEQAIIDYRLENDIDENTVDALMTEGNTAETLEDLSQEHSDQLAANESTWGPYSWGEYNWEDLYERHELHDVCLVGATNGEGETYIETYERGHLMAVTQVDAVGRNQTETVDAVMNNWEDDAYQLAKLEYENASRIAVGVTPSNETTHVYVAAAVC